MKDIEMLEPKNRVVRNPTTTLTFNSASHKFSVQELFQSQSYHQFYRKYSRVVILGANEYGKNRV